MADLISVIVPVYNIESYLPACLDSLLSQEYADIEILVIDDGSTDTSPQICDDYSCKDSRIRVLHKPNGGLSSARNAGLNMMHGKYCCFVDGDDFVAPNFLSSLYEKICQEHAAIVLCDLEYVYEQGGECEGKEKYISGSLPQGPWQERMFWQYSKTVARLPCSVSWNKLFKSELFEDCSYEVGRKHEDEFILPLLLQRAGFVSVVRESLYFYRQRAGSIIMNLQGKFDQDGIDYRFERCQYFCEHGWYDFAADLLLEIMDVVAKQRKNAPNLAQKQCRKIDSMVQYVIKNSENDCRRLKIENMIFQFSIPLHRNLHQLWYLRKKI